MDYKLKTKWKQLVSSTCLALISRRPPHHSIRRPSSLSPSTFRRRRWRPGFIVVINNKKVSNDGDGGPDLCFTAVLVVTGNGGPDLCFRRRRWRPGLRLMVLFRNDYWC
ncbi:hypothetical protein HanIR_Chr13g0647951 [Helianthus annuus]|nr:hypothetical protein HanIR_Chr13g0647951 [Helianthus annuus]